MPRKLTEGEANTIIGGTIPTHLQTDTKLTRSDTSVANPEPGYTDRSPGHKSGTGGAADHRNFTRGRAFSKVGNSHRAYQAYKLEYDNRPSHDPGHVVAKESARRDMMRHKPAHDQYEKDHPPIDYSKVDTDPPPPPPPAATAAAPPPPATAATSDPVPEQKSGESKKDFRPRNQAWKERDSKRTEGESEGRQGIHNEESSGFQAMADQHAEKQQAIVDAHNKREKTAEPEPESEPGPRLTAFIDSVHSKKRDSVAGNGGHRHANHKPVRTPPRATPIHQPRGRNH